jgi:hypothetical protein
MIKYLIKTEIDGIEIRLIQSAHGFVVIYGMERKAYTIHDKALALKAYRESVSHALDMI